MQERNRFSEAVLARLSGTKTLTSRCETKTPFTVSAAPYPARGVSVGSPLAAHSSRAGLQRSRPEKLAHMWVQLLGCFPTPIRRDHVGRQPKDGLVAIRVHRLGQF
jgi:hypothetical protein